MFALSYIWHGLALTDLNELRMPLTRYLAITGAAYVLVGLIICLAIRVCLMRGWVSLKRGFPAASMLVGAMIGHVVYLLVFVLGLSFAGHELRHVVVDVLWQMFEQAIGGLVVSLGMIYGMHRSFMEAEHAR
ncbi:MAG: hypothetical protein ABI373_05530 [Flavobacteriales bacterium]